jgi:hypothetical protein
MFPKYDIGSIHFKLQIKHELMQRGQGVLLS